jgi:hypothetical protein
LKIVDLVQLLEQLAVVRIPHGYDVCVVGGGGEFDDELAGRLVLAELVQIHGGPLES